jgi:hypothetical protein
MSLDYILPNGVTMGFSNPAERDAYLSSDAGAGAQTQEAAMAANPGQSMEQIKNQNHASHYGVGGAGFGQAPLGTDRNWGANPDKARWIAQQTGYGGDFGNGSFNQWSQQNGINGTQLEQQWAQQQGQRYALPQTMGFGGQQTMGFGQNNWASMPGMQGLLNGFGNQPTPDIGWANTGSSMMAGPSSSNGWQGPSDGGWKSNGTGPNMDYANAPMGQAMGGGAANTGHNMLWSW